MTQTPHHHLAALAVLALVACGTAACSGSDDDSSATTTGHGGATAQPASQPSPSPSAGPSASVAPVTLRLGTDDGPDAPGALQLQHFVQEVATSSGGAITITPVYSADHHQLHWDQIVAGMVKEGQLDLGLVPSRAWDELGVTSLSALTAPFLITSDTLTNTVVGDDQLVEQLESGLPAYGVSALGLFAEGLRHPFGFQHVLGGASDYQGGELRAPYSGGTVAMFKALGATTDDDVADTQEQIGAESSYLLAPAGSATGNVTFFPKVNVLVLGDAARATLSDDQLAVLQQAADATRDWAVDSRPTDAEAAATFCGQAGEIGAASQAQVDSLVTATRPVVDQLRQDPVTAQAIDEIQALAANDAPAEPVTSCPDSGGAVSAAINGSYGFTITPAAAEAAGMSEQTLLDENTGKFTMTFADGAWTETQIYSQGSKKGQAYHGSGSYTLDGAHLKIFWDHEAGDWTTVDVTVAEDGSLDFNDPVDGGGPEFQALDEVMFTHWSPVKG